MVTLAMRSTITALIMLLPSYAFAVPPAYTFQTGVGSDDISGDADSFYYLTGSALLSKGLSRNSIVDLLGEVTTIDYSDDSDRSGEELFLQGTYSYTPRAGFRVPTYSLGLRHREEYLSEDTLDASTTTLILSMAYRLNDRGSVFGGLKFGERDSSDDSDTTSVFVSFDYRYTPRWLLYTTLNLADEEIDAGTGGPIAGIPANSARSFIGGGHLPSEGGSAAASAADESDNTFVTLGASFVINSVNTLDLSLNRSEYETSSGDVTGNIYSVDFFHRF